MLRVPAGRSEHILLRVGYFPAEGVHIVDRGQAHWKADVIRKLQRTLHQRTPSRGNRIQHDRSDSRVEALQSAQKDCEANVVLTVPGIGRPLRSTARGIENGESIRHRLKAERGVYRRTVVVEWVQHGLCLGAHTRLALRSGGSPNLWHELGGRS